MSREKTTINMEWAGGRDDKFSLEVHGEPLDILTMFIQGLASILKELPEEIYQGCLKALEIEMESTDDDVLILTDSGGEGNSTLH